MNHSADIVTLQRLQDAANVVRQYNGSAQSTALVKMLGLLVESYVDELMHCQEKDLVRLQACIAQSRKLMQMIIGQDTNGRL
jgi:hypothetical protein